MIILYFSTSNCNFMWYDGTNYNTCYFCVFRVNDTIPESSYVKPALKPPNTVPLERFRYLVLHAAPYLILSYLISTACFVIFLSTSFPLRLYSFVIVVNINPRKISVIQPFIIIIFICWYKIMKRKLCFMKSVILLYQ